MMWTFQTDILNEGTLKFQIHNDGKTISYRDWIDLIQNSVEFCTFYTELLRTCDFKGFFWEVKPINKNELDFDFEFVLVEGSNLKYLVANSSRFEKYFTPHEDAVSFPNLRGDAQLVVPTKISEAKHYAHLALFLRHAPKSQILSFWKKVGTTFSQFLGEDKKWLSTAGLGVHWLHVRIDSSPKYYRHKDYK
ncbi:hypothetical protein [uncultured Psychroserpens sp.]|uniref:DUF6940 family protein n=1 Tax=uncultured Psychroserpens sp. TaxID=255436 RepID=UPI0026374EF8|nr:hypothetical protein [uncultured Psychroserpens sp.]